MKYNGLNSNNMFTLKKGSHSYNPIPCAQEVVSCKKD